MSKRERLECPYCKAYAIKPPSKDPNVSWLWSLPNNSPFKQLQDDHKFVIERENKVMVKNTELKKIAARAINALDMFADQSRGKYAEECRTVAKELTKRYREAT